MREAWTGSTHAARGVRWLTGALLCLFALPAAALGYSTASGYTARDYATGFRSASCCAWGPIGVAFGRAGSA